MCKPVDAPASATSTTRILGGRRTAVAEVRAQLKISVPVAFSAVLRRSMVIWTVGFVGRLGPSAMAAAALANSATNTFALSIMVGLSSASVTLVSQAVGAKDTRQAGLWLHRALVVHAVTAVPLTVVLLCFGPLLVATGQDPALSVDAGSYAAILIPGMWAWCGRASRSPTTNAPAPGAQPMNASSDPTRVPCWRRAIMWAMQPWLQAHGIVKVQTVTSGAAAILHPCLLSLLVPAAGLHGAAAADAASTALSVGLLAVTVAAAPQLRARLPFVRPCRASLARLPVFLRLGCPGVVMMFEWWASEINILASGLLPQPALALSALSVYQSRPTLGLKPEAHRQPTPPLTSLYRDRPQRRLLHAAARR